MIRKFLERGFPNEKIPTEKKRSILDVCPHWEKKEREPDKSLSVILFASPQLWFIDEARSFRISQQLS